MRVSHPGVEDPARVRRSVLQVVVDPARQHLLGEAYHVGLDIEVLVAPHLAAGPGSGLNLVHHEGDVVLLADGSQTLEKLRTAVIVSSLRLYRLRDDPRHRPPLRALGERRSDPTLRNVTYSLLYQLLHLSEAPVVLLAVLPDVLLQRISVLREVCLGPGQGGNIHALDWPRVGAAQQPDSSAVKASFE